MADEAVAEETSLVEPHSQIEGICSNDGSLDFNGRPAVRYRSGVWRACYFILGTEFCERLAYYGISTNLVTFLTTSLHEDNASAARNVTTWQGTCYLTSLIGAFLADSYLGKYWTIAAFSSVYFIGLIILTVTATLPALKPSPRESFLFVGLYLIALGTGGIKPCVSSFGADQFDDTHTSERTQKGSFFNWFYFCINLGALIAGTVLVWVQVNVGWAIGFGIPTFCMALAIGCFFVGSNMYRFQKPGGSPVTRVCQVLVAAIRNYNVQLPEDSFVLYEVDGAMSVIEGSRKLTHTRGFRFLDKASVILYSADKQSGASSDLWQLCTVTQVEELKILLRMFPIWATTVIFSAVYSQNSSLFVEQGAVMDRQIGSLEIPAATLSTVDVVSFMLWVPIYDQLLVPLAHRFTGQERGFSELGRIGVGLFLSILAMVSAALVELWRLSIANAEGLVHEKVAVPISVLWQMPQYALVGAGEVFTAIGQVEFFYNEAPDAMRSLCSAFALVTVALGSYLSSVLVELVVHFTGRQDGWISDNLNEGHLDRFFWLIAVLSIVNLVVFGYYAARYRYKRGS